MIRVSGSWVLPFCQTPRLPLITITIVCLLSSEIKEKERLRSILSVNKPSLYKCFRYNNNVNIVNSCHWILSRKHWPSQTMIIFESNGIKEPTPQYIIHTSMSTKPSSSPVRKSGFYIKNQCCQLIMIDLFQIIQFDFSLSVNICRNQIWQLLPRKHLHVSIITMPSHSHHIHCHWQSTK